MQTPYSVQATSQSVCIVLAQNADNLATAYIERATREEGRRRAKVCTNESMHTINFGANVREIGPRCFINCPALEELTIPDTVQRLGLRAFNKCTGLKKIVLGRGIREIGAYTFSFCTALERITLLSPLTEVDEYAFSDCGAFRGIYCRFAESEWTEPAVAEGNDAFRAAQRHFE